MTRVVTAALLALLVLLANPGRALGYCLETTCDPTKPEEACELDDAGCVLTGVPFGRREDG